MIIDYLNQSATWKQATGLNEYGEPITASQTIKVRWEGKRRLVRNPSGQEVVSEARVFCLEAIQPGEIITYGGKDWPVITVSEVPDLDGTAYREVAV